MLLSNVCYGEALKDEICLEGLEGITLESLWVRISNRFGIGVTDKIRRKFWNIILQLEQLQFYEIPKPRPVIQFYDRFASRDEVGLVIQPDPNINIYPHRPIKNVRGSCQFYETRKNISTEVIKTSYDDVIKRWPNTLIIVGDINSRWNALAPGLPFSICEQLSDGLYNLLERIGRSRSNGEITAGSESLSLLEKDPKTLSYFHKHLISHNLVKKQHVNIKLHSGGTPSVLLQLTRYYQKLFCLVDKNIEIIESYLKQQPAKMAPIPQIKAILSTSQLKHYLKRREFREKISIIQKIPYREVYPNATDRECVWANGKNRTVTVLKLKDKPDDEDNINNSNSEESIIKMKRGSTFVGEGLLQQVYACIYASKNQGMSLKDIENELGIESSTARYAVKYTIAHGYLYSSSIDSTKQRITRYLANEFKQTSEELQNEHAKLRNILNESKEAFESKNIINESMNENSDHDMTIDSIGPLSPKEVTVKNEDSIISDQTSTINFKSLKKVKRANIILEFLRKEKITSRLFDLSKYISTIEAQNNQSRGIIDRKCLIKILNYMENKGQIKLHRIKISDEPKHPSMLFISELNINSHHHYIKSAVAEAKHRLIMRKSNLSSDIRPLCDIKSNALKTDQDLKNPYPQLPKYSKLRLFHQFMFYLVYDHQNEECELTPNIKSILEGEKAFQNELPRSYNKAFDKCMFVPPINDMSKRPPGWLLLYDAITRLPLCIYSQLIKIDIRIPGILEYLNDPIKSQILINNLPDTIQYYLMKKGKHNHSIYKIAEYLCLLGLIQFGEQIMKNKEKFFVYINKNAILWDTTTSKAGYHRVEDKEYSRETFTFQTKADVDNYWERLFSICFQTRLGDRYACLGEEVEYQQPEIKMAYALKKRSFEEAENLDVGYIPGDGFGAAGIDTMMYSHLKRSWNNTVFLSVIKSTKKKLLDKSHPTNFTYQRKKPLMMRGQNHIALSTKNKKVRTVIPRKVSKVSVPRVDEIDKIVLQKLGSKRSTWNVAEDQLLFLCRIAMHILHPSGYLPYFPIVRDIFYNIFNHSLKTSFAVRRRDIFLMRNPQNVRYVEISLTEVRRYDMINKKYYNLFSRFKQRKSTNPIEDCKIYFIELVHVLYLLLVEKNIQNQLSIQIPATVTELYNQFTVETPSLNTFKRKIIDTNYKTEIRSNVLSSFIHGAMWCSIGKESSTFSLLSIYRSFPELVLRSTIYSLRSSGLIAMKRYAEKSLEKKYITKKFSSNTSHYKLSKNYIYQAIVALPHKIHTQIYEFLNMLKEKAASNENLGIISGGVSATLLELSMIDCVQLNINILNIKESCEDEFGSQSEITEEGSLYLNTPTMNICDLSISLLMDYESLFSTTIQKMEKITSDIIMDAVFIPNESTTKPNYSEYNSPFAISVFNFIREKCEVGTDPKELNEKFISTQQCTVFELQYILKELAVKNMIRRMGHNSIKWIAEEYLSLWFVKAVPSNEERKRPKSVKTDSCQENVNTIDDISNNFQHDDPSNLQSPMQSDIGQKRKYSKDEQGESSNKKSCFNDVRNTTDEFNTSVISNLNLQNAMDCDELNKPESSDVIDIDMDDYRSQKISSLSSDDILKMINEGEKVFVSPRPWIKPDGSLNYYVFFRWAGAILNYILYHPCVKLVVLQKRFIFLPLHQIRLLIEVLEKIECAQLICVKSKKASLWSKQSAYDITTEPVTGLEDDSEIHVEALKGALLKFSIFKGHVLKQC